MVWVFLGNKLHTTTLLKQNVNGSSEKNTAKKKLFDVAHFWGSTIEAYGAYQSYNIILVGGFNPSEKYIVKLDHFPR